MRAVYLNQSREPAEGMGLRLLHTLFSSSLSPEKRAEILERDYSIVFNQEEKTMFDMFRFAEENGLRKGRREGRKEGREEGRKEGREEGRQEGRKEGTEETYLKVIRRLLLKGNSLEDVREMLDLTPKQMQDFAPCMES